MCVCVCVCVCVLCGRGGGGAEIRDKNGNTLCDPANFIAGFVVCYLARIFHLFVSLAVGYICI